MKLSTWFAGVMLVTLAAIAQAHTHLKGAVPAEGSTVMTSPEHIVLKFAAATRLTAATLQKEGGNEQKLGPLPAEPATDLTVPAPKLAPGKYTVKYRTVSSDNHVMSGTLHFTVAEQSGK
jgi:methionine-rich copper-binding protein CopC